MPVLVALALALPWRVARADETAAPPNPSPLLEQLNRETEKLYHDEVAGITRHYRPLYESS